MKPTPGPWIYVPLIYEVQGLGQSLASLVDGEGLSLRCVDGDPIEGHEENDANGYLMAAAPNLRDELGNIARAVRAYLDHDPDEPVAGRSGPDEEDHLLTEMDVMLARAERALETIFPPEHES